MPTRVKKLKCGKWVEPDVIRRDGNLLYILNQYRGLVIVNLDTQSILAHAPTYGYPRDLYIEGGRAYVLVSQAANYTKTRNTVHYDIESRLYVVDVDSPAAPIIESDFVLPGDLVDSRLVGHVLYAVSSAYQWYWYDVPVAAAAVAKKQTDGGSWVTSVNIADPSDIRQADQLHFNETGDLIQATSSAIFVASP